MMSNSCRTQKKKDIDGKKNQKYCRLLAALLLSDLVDLARGIARNFVRKLSIKQTSMLYRSLYKLCTVLEYSSTGITQKGTAWKRCRSDVSEILHKPVRNIVKPIPSFLKMSILQTL